MANIVRRTTSGGQARYDVRWRLPDGDVRTKTFRRRADAEAYRRKVEADELIGVVTDHRLGKLILRDLAEQWFNSTPTKRSRSLERDRSNLECHVFPDLGGRRVQTISRVDIQYLVDRLTGTHASSTVVRIFSTLRALLSYAERCELIARNPTRGVRLPRVSGTHRPVLTAEDLELLAGTLGSRDAVFMWVGVILGLRWGEAAGLRAGAIDVRRHTVTVSEQLGRDGTSQAPKSDAGCRVLAAPAWLIDELVAVLTARTTASDDPTQLVFQTPAGTPLQYNNWRYRTWVPATEAAGLPGLRFHDLRSNAATALVAAGVDVKTAQSRLGHSTPVLTLQIYARATADADRAAAEAVSERLRPRDPRAMQATPASQRRAPNP